MDPTSISDDDKKRIHTLFDEIAPVLEEADTSCEITLFVLAQLTKSVVDYWADEYPGDALPRATAQMFREILKVTDDRH